MDVSEEAAKAAFRSFFMREPEPGTSDDARMQMLCEAICAALAVMPDQYRAGWIAGRDAARKAAMQAAFRRGDIGTLDAALHAISNMEPPA